MSTTQMSPGETTRRSNNDYPRVRRDFTETKAGFKTTEFWAMLLFVVGAIVAAYLDDDDSFGRDDGWMFSAIVAAGYLVSRGLAKLGVREPYNEQY